MEILHQLGIEPGVIAVNIVGFLLLMWLLSKFAFGPVRELMGERERQIDSDLADAEHQREAARRDRRAIEEELAQVGQRSRQMLAEARTQADQLREEMLDRAREQSDRIVAEGRRTVELSADEARSQLRRETADVAIAISARVIRDSLDEERQAALVDAFIADIERRAALRATDEGARPQ